MGSGFSSSGFSASGFSTTAAAIVAVIRRTLTALGTRIGSRQIRP